jgi:hypothetical protein
MFSLKRSRVRRTVLSNTNAVGDLPFSRPPRIIGWTLVVQRAAFEMLDAAFRVYVEHLGGAQRSANGFYGPSSPDGWDSVLPRGSAERDALYAEYCDCATLKGATRYKNAASTAAHLSCLSIIAPKPNWYTELSTELRSALQAYNISRWTSQGMHEFFRLI